jgi:diacylglycerol kinase (ATP)
VTTVAVVAHSGKSFGGGLTELRKVLAEAGHPDPLWFEVPKSRRAKQAIRRAVKGGATLIFVWGGDGMVQRCVDALAAPKPALAILPAGTGNGLASSLGIPQDIPQAVAIGLRGVRRRLDVGVINGERFAALAGTGFDAVMMDEADGGAKKTLGRLAYVRSSLKAMQTSRVQTKIQADGAVWFEGQASCVLFGNIGVVTGGLKLFPRASPRDGVLEVGVVTASHTKQWIEVFSRVLTGHPGRSPHIQTTKAREIVVELARKRPYELDGGVRKKTKRLEVRVEKRAITLCVPGAAKRKSQ